LHCLYPQDSGDTIDLSEDEDCSSAFTRLLQVREQLSGWQVQESLLKHQIQQRMGQASHARFTAGSVSWKRGKSGSRRFLAHTS
jgi:hypothetical protein